jgi:hypothetical protein
MRRTCPQLATPVSLVMALLAAGLASPAGASNTNPALEGGPRHPMPIVRPGRGATPTRARLEYYGGRVISNVQVVMVLWGAGAYAPFVSGTLAQDQGAPSLASFFAELTASPYIAGLGQYDTRRPGANGLPGSQQAIGRGAFSRQVQIAPAVANNGARIDDVNIVSELAAQLSAGALPAPKDDGAGNTNTVYLVYFPPGKTITLGTDRACVTLCAYHGTFRWNERDVYYAVVPDMSSGSGCDQGCGTGTPFEIATAVASHELAEAITDPEVGLAPGVGPPLGWYDPVNGEIGDICAGSNAVLRVSDRASFVVQKLWSNEHGACVIPSVTPTEIAVAPISERSAIASGPVRSRARDASPAEASGAATVGPEAQPETSVERTATVMLPQVRASSTNGSPEVPGVNSAGTSVAAAGMSGTSNAVDGASKVEAPELSGLEGAKSRGDAAPSGVGDACACAQSHTVGELHGDSPGDSPVSGTAPAATGTVPSAAPAPAASGAASASAMSGTEPTETAKPASGTELSGTTSGTKPTEGAKPMSGTEPAEPAKPMSGTEPELSPTPPSDIPAAVDVTDRAPKSAGEHGPMILVIDPDAPTSDAR